MMFSTITTTASTSVVAVAVAAMMMMMLMDVQVVQGADPCYLGDYLTTFCSTGDNNDCQFCCGSSWNDAKCPWSTEPADWLSTWCDDSVNAACQVACGGGWNNKDCPWVSDWGSLYKGNNETIPEDVDVVADDTPSTDTTTINSGAHNNNIASTSSAVVTIVSCVGVVYALL